jgi:hypothetical protein
MDDVLNLLKDNRPSSTKFKYVYYDKISQLWRAWMCINSSRYCLGEFATDEEAALAQDAVACLIPGMKLNFPDPGIVVNSS